MRYLYEFREYGKQVGYDIAYDNGVGLSIADLNDDFVDLCLETESEHFRQYSPFEFYAHDMNDYRDPERAWEVYGEAVYSGILQAVRELKKTAGNE